MTASGGAPAAEPFFLKTAGGTRFCLFHAPLGACLGAVLYVSPFAEEMNRSRRMAALQARELAKLGYGVLQLDLHGCGDSSGDFMDARWETWKHDLALGAAWLHERLGQPLILWGSRLGVLLALDYARTAPHPVASMLLWQPILSAHAYLTQFLRLRVAGALLGEDGAGQQGTNALRATLQSGQAVEVAGYRLAPALAASIDALPPLDAMPPSCPVHWFEAIAAAGQEPSPRVLQAAASWRNAGVDLHFQAVICPPFWSTSEITISPAWLEATSAALRMGRHDD
jgi:exosortase A-associated hydrolase 2